MSLRLLSVEVFVVALHEEEAMMVSAADSLSMESESSSEASAELVVSGRALLTTGDAFRGTFPMWCFFSFWVQSWCFTRSSSCFFSSLAGFV